MRCMNPWLTMVVMFLSGVSSSMARAEDASPVRLGSQNESDRVAASDALTKQGETAIPALLEIINKDQTTAGKVAEQTLMRIVHQAAGTDRQSLLGKLLAAELPNKDKYNLATRKTICRALAFVGNDSNDVVLALYRSLNDRELEEVALYAMGHIPGQTTTDALNAGLQISEEPLKIAIMNTLAERADPRSLQHLVGWLENKSPGIVAAALNAIAHIAEPAAARIVEEALKANKPTALDCLLTLAQTYSTANMRNDALSILIPLRDNKQLTNGQRSRWLNLLGRLGGEVAAGFVMHALDDTDARVRVAALEALVNLPGGEATTMIARKMAAVRGPLKIDLLGVLARRDSAMTPDAAKKIQEAATTTESAVRVAAIQTIEAGGVEAAFGAVLLALDDPPDPVRDAAVHALSHMPGPFVTRQIVYELRGKPGLRQILYVEALGRRGDPIGLEALTAAAKDPDASVRAAAIRGLGRLGQESACDTLLAALMGADPADRAAAAAALRRLHGDAVNEKLLAAYPAASPEIKAALREALATRQDPRVVALLTAAQGLITHWWMVGPFPNPNNAMFAKPYFPEEKVDLTAETKLDGTPMKWQHHQTPNPDGVVDLFNVFGKRENVGAYAYAEVTIDPEQDAVLKMGSDDSIVVWLNGKQVHANSTQRGIVIDQDQAKCHLEKGLNRILVKILNGQSDWKFCLRLTTASGAPIVVAQRTQ